MIIKTFLLWIVQYEFYLLNNVKLTSQLYFWHQPQRVFISSHFDVWEFFPTLPSSSLTSSWVSCNLTQFRCCPPRESQTPRVQASVLQECSHFRRQSKSRDQPAVNQRFPQHSSSWIHLLEQLTELREIFTYYIMKGYNSQMEEMYGARYVRRGIILSKIQTLSF